MNNELQDIAESVAKHLTTITGKSFKLMAAKCDDPWYVEVLHVEDPKSVYGVSIWRDRTSSRGIGKPDKLVRIRVSPCWPKHPDHGSSRPIDNPKVGEITLSAEKLTSQLASDIFRRVLNADYDADRDRCLDKVKRADDYRESVLQAKTKVEKVFKRFAPEAQNAHRDPLSREFYTTGRVDKLYISELDEDPIVRFQVQVPLSVAEEILKMVK